MDDLVFSGLSPQQLGVIFDVARRLQLPCEMNGEQRAITVHVATPMGAYEFGQQCGVAFQRLKATRARTRRG